MSPHSAIFAGYGLIAPTDAREMSICCPFHGERHPSCSVNLERGLFNCFVCGAKGTTLDFIRLYEQCSTLEALKRFLSRTDEEAPLPSNVLANTRTERRKSIIAAYVVYRQSLRVDWQHAPDHYLAKRGFTPETLEHFGCRITAGTPYSVLFPIYEGTFFRGYQARRTDDGKPKYLSNRGFSKTLTYDGQLVPGPVAIVEGKTDQMMAYQYGFSNAAVLFGCRVTPEQFHKIAQYATSIYDWRHNDEAGRQSDLVRLARPSGIPVLRPSFPVGIKDIAEMTYTQFVRFLYHTYEQQVS